ncbi:Gfo/Idh/MocA family protein [Mycetocola reblochoni]|uniref:Oxidoreductase n=1 Tax=Mycetocola reblochoni REB411 TaxID=1255698 RepID=A0A1R4KA73_9MICO|nr:Gfo/Idh/MocA family oxidoreductase [Mycetocola reblochoni]SJN41032.1 Oxidoreductase [Mycetocola reblochoni REB411]
MRSLPSDPRFETDAGEPALRWGILAPGGIAAAFVRSLRHTVQRPVAVGSRSLDRAQRFAAEHGIESAYGSYRELVEDPEVDVVYVAAPHSEHRELGLLAIAAGKHVLIEKPMATTAEDVRLLAAAAAEAGVFLMEAMWSRYLPQAAVLRAVLREGLLGDPVTVVADHGQLIPFDPNGRLYRPELAGGAVLDLGVYAVQFDSMVFGAPRALTAVGTGTGTGVDATATLVLDHGEGRQSTLTTSLAAASPSRAFIAGSQARIETGELFYTPTTLTLSGPELDEPVRWVDDSGRDGHLGLSWQATALASFVASGLRESPLHTLAETAEIAGTMAEAIRQIAPA